MKFTQKIDFDLASVYARRNCKKCYGRGILTYHDVGATQPRYGYCSCAMRNKRRHDKSS